ncbi:MAG: ABC transporter permease [Clostridium sp.]|nr:ABC transporter permease [Clostridium sp.]
MIRYLIKNNFKLMLRNKLILALIFLGPVLVIAILSSAFSELMKSYEGVKAFTAGYRIQAESRFYPYMDTIKAAGKDAGITLLEYPEGEPKEVMENNGLSGFVEFETDTYTVYESSDFKTEGITLEYFLNRVMRESAQAALSAAEEEEIELPVAKIPYMPAVSAVDYYGIIYIVYFAWCGFICTANVLGSEKKYQIERRYQVSAVSGCKRYLAKWIPNVLAMSICLALSTIITVWLFDIHWGNLFLSAVILFATIMASSAFGLMFYYMFNNLAMTVIAVFTSVWFMGFFGGSFETYMYSAWTDPVKNLSPIYHINRALVELSCMGHSSYTKSAVIYLFIITAVCSAIAVIADSIRKRGRA